MQAALQHWKFLTSHRMMNFDIPDFTMCPDLTTTCTTCLRTAFGRETVGNQENFGPTTTSMFSKPITPYVETVGRFSELVVAGEAFPRGTQMGRGAFGTVFESEDPRTGERVALKVMRYDISDVEKRMFDREVEILASMKHETLLGLRGFMPFSQASPANPPVIVTEFMAGGSLQSLISEARQGRIHEAWDDTMKWIVLYGTAVGMMTLHANNIMHRDLKPDNVLLDEFCLPKVADFGLGKFVSANGQQQTFDGGTPGFIAPEGYDGICSFAADVFSFGVLVYVTLTNNRPFPGLNPFLISQKVRQGERPTIPPEISDAYRQLIESCWDNIPENRPTFEAVVAALESANFWTSSINIQLITKYQSFVAPERAAAAPICAQLFAGHQDELNAIFADSITQSNNFAQAIVSSAMTKLPAAILRAKVQNLVDTDVAIPELIEMVQPVIVGCIIGLHIGVHEQRMRASPDVVEWLRDNHHLPDIVGGFCAFMCGVRAVERELLITEIPNLVRDSPLVLGVQEAWEGLVAKLREIFGDVMPLPDYELYPVITPDSLLAGLQ
jgi:serine/threonine protein kinase